MRRNKQRDAHKPSNIRLLLGELPGEAKHRYWVSIIYLAVDSVILTLLSGVLYRSAILLIEDGSLKQTWLELLLILACIVILSIITYYAEQGVQSSSSHADRHFRSQLVSHIIRLPIPNWDLRGSPYYLNLLGRDVTNFSTAYRKLYPFFVRMLFAAGLGFAIVAMVNWHLAIFSLASGCVYLITAHTLKGRLSKIQQERQKSLQTSTLTVQEMLEGFSTLKFYGTEEAFQLALAKAQQDYVKMSKSYARIRSLEVGLSSFGSAFSYVGSLAYSLYLVSQGHWSLSDAMFVWPTAMQMSYAIQKMGGLILDHQEPLVSMNRIRQTLALPNETTNERQEKADRDLGALKLTEFEPELEFENVSFHYSGGTEAGSKLFLQNVSFQVQAGERIVIQGESGSGKSTLFKLLLGFYKPTTGVIRWRGMDLDSLSLHDRRLIFAYLPQFPQLYMGTVEDNLRLVSPESSKQDLEVATNQAQINYFEGRREEFFEAEVGFGGRKVSGGERQRLGLARAYLKGASVLLLDEGTSALDASLEEQVMTALTRDRDSTILYITHRAQSASWADRVLFLEDGRIIDEMINVDAIDGFSYSLI